MRERKALGLMPPERVAREVVRIIERGGNERTFPWPLKLYVVLSNAVSVRSTDRLVDRYMDWKGIPEVCEMPRALQLRLGAVAGPTGGRFDDGHGLGD